MAEFPVVASSLKDALSAGYQVWDREPGGLVVRRRPNGDSWEYGFVLLSENLAHG